MSLLFPADRRPSVADVVRLVEAGDLAVLPFSISHQPAVNEGWLELLAQGLAFDLAGMTPGAPEPMPGIAHRYGIAADLSDEPLAAICLRPGEHLRGAENLIPVVRAMVGIAAGLAGLPGLRGVVWHPARSAIAGAVFQRAVAVWLDGGAFPALGLTALVAEPDGGFRSEGLAFFTGQELRLEPAAGRSARDSARIAVRLIDALVGAKPVRTATHFAGPDGERLLAEPAGDHGIVRITLAG